MLILAISDFAAKAMYLKKKKKKPASWENTHQEALTDPWTDGSQCSWLNGDLGAQTAA